MPDDLPYPMRKALEALARTRTSGDEDNDNAPTASDPDAPENTNALLPKRSD